MKGKIKNLNGIINVFAFFFCFYSVAEEFSFNQLMNLYGEQSDCKYRSLITPSDKTDRTSHTEQKRSGKSSSMSWAKTLKRVFEIDIQTCPNCGGQIKILSSILSPQVIKRVLKSIGENSKVPELAPPRGPPETEENFITV